MYTGESLSALAVSTKKRFHLSRSLYDLLQNRSPNQPETTPLDAALTIEVWFPNGPPATPN